MLKKQSFKPESEKRRFDAQELPSSLTVAFHTQEEEALAGAAWEARLEDYLDQVCAPLVGSLPYAARQELRREIHQHLRSLSAAYQEVGATPDSALSQALEKFGDPAFVIAQWRPEIQRRKSGRRDISAWFRSQRQGIGATLAAGSLFALLLMSALPGGLLRSPNLKNAAPTAVRQGSAANFDALHSSIGFRHTEAVRQGMDCIQCHRGSQSPTTERGAQLLQDWKQKTFSQKAK